MSFPSFFVVFLERKLKNKKAPLESGGLENRRQLRDT